MFELQQEDLTLFLRLYVSSRDNENIDIVWSPKQGSLPILQKKKRHVISELITSWMRPNRWTAFSARDWYNTQRQQVNANTVYWICGDGLELWYCRLLTQWSCVTVERAKDLSDSSCKWCLVAPWKWTLFSPQLIVQDITGGTRQDCFLAWFLRSVGMGEMCSTQDRYENSTQNFLGTFIEV